MVTLVVSQKWKWVLPLVVSKRGPLSTSIGGSVECTTWRKPRCICVCVCVQPWTKGFPPPLFLSYMSRGMERTREAPSNEAPHVLLGHHQGRLMTYLQSTVAHAVHSFWFDSWFFMCYFPKTAFSRLCIAASRASETFFQQFKSLDLFALLFHHLPSHRDNCVN